MSDYTPQTVSSSEADILRKAEALRAETIHTFFARLFSKRNDAAYPAHAAPAE